MWLAAGAAVLGVQGAARWERGLAYVLLGRHVCIGSMDHGGRVESIDETLPLAPEAFPSARVD